MGQGVVKNGIGKKYRAQYSEDSGWWVTCGPRRPTAERIWLEGPMTQDQAFKRAKELQDDKEKKEIN